MPTIAIPTDERSAARARGRAYAAAVLRALAALAALGSRRSSARLEAEPALPPETGEPWRLPRSIRIALAALGALSLWIAFVGIQLELGDLPVRATTLGKPLALAVLLVAGSWTLADARSGRWRLPQALRELARAELPLRAGAVLCAVFTAWVWSSVPRAARSLREAREHWGAPATRVRSDTYHGHLEPLVDWVARDGGGGPLLLVVDDVNPRGHLAAYYAYPRVLWMTPELQRWSGDARKSSGRARDPGFAELSLRPAVEASARWAAACGARLVIARPGGVETAGEPALEGSR